jgi:hypothetical protein
MTTLEIIFGVLVALALLMICLFERAPYGYEDEDGFHYGTPPPRRFGPGLHVIRSLSDFDTPSSRSGDQRAADGEAPSSVRERRL